MLHSKGESSPLGKLLLRSRARRISPRTRLAVWIAVILGATIVGGVLASVLSISGQNPLSLTLGTALQSRCEDSPILELDSAFPAGQTTLNITAIRLRSIPIECDGVYLRVELFDAGGAKLDGVVWHLTEVSATDAEFLAVANGSETSTANSSANDISTNYPDSETGSLGLSDTAIDPDAVSSFEITVSGDVLDE